MSKRFRIEEETNHIDPKRDVPNDREIHLNNNSIKITKVGPFGFYTIHYTHGITPKVLQGTWIGLEDAKQAIKNYLQADGRLYQAQGQL